MENLQKGELIRINENNEVIKAKFLKFNGDQTKMNLLIKGRMAWRDASVFLDKEIKSWSEMKSEQDKQAKNFIESKKQEKEKKTDPSPEEKQGTIHVHKDAGKCLKLISSKKEISIEELSDSTGFQYEKIESMMYILIQKNIVKREIKDDQIIFKYNGETKKGIQTIEKKLKKKDYKISKADRVLDMFKKGMDVKKISEILETPAPYIREIIDIKSKDFEIPKDGTAKKEIYDLLMEGLSVKDIAEKTGKSKVYCNKVKRSMQSSGII